MKKKSFDLSGLSLNSETNLSPLHRVFICGTHVLPQLRQFWTDMRTELADEHPYRDSIGGMRLRLAELQESDEEVRKIRAKGLDGYEEIDGVLHHQGLAFVPEVIRTELISRHHDDPLAGHFGIDKTRELIGRKYDWARLLPMAEFAYNNAKNASTGHTPFELNCDYQPQVSYEEDVDPRSKSKSADELSAELRELMIVCRENLHHAQELQKQA